MATTWSGNGAVKPLRPPPPGAEMEAEISTSDAQAVFELLERHEKAVWMLYQRFAGVYESHADFWTRLANDEKRHVLWVNNLARMVAEGGVTFHDRGVDAAVIHASMSYVASTLRKLDDGRLTLLEALSAASKIEADAVDGSFFENFDLSSPQGQAIRKGLEQQSDDHRMTVLVELNKVRRGLW